MIRIYFLLLLFSFSIEGYSQWDLSGEVTGQALASSGERLPFWMYHNTRGRISEETNFAGWISGEASYSFNENSVLRVGAGALVRDGERETVLPDEIYLQYNYEWLEIIAGRQHKKELYDGLSATNENILWSLNARPLPGVQIRTATPVFFDRNKKLGVLASLEEYVLEEDRYVSRARVHHKSLHLVYRPGRNWEVKGGIQHFAQWGGISPTNGQQPVNFADYLLVLTGREGSERSRKGDQQNVIGNHLGSYELYVKKKYSDLEFEFIYNHIFEDGTGSRFANFPDGRYGIFITNPDREEAITSFIYEFYYTKNQSMNSSAPHKNDNYFNHTLTYNSGWTYYNNIIGLPFFTYDKDEGVVVNNVLQAHHLGLAGRFFQNYPFKLLLSHSRNRGTCVEGNSFEENVIFSNLDVQLLQRFIEINIQFSVETNSSLSPVYGSGLSLSKKF